MSTLSSRYVTAVSRSVPESQREDVDAEVAAAIEDLTEARLEAGPRLQMSNAPCCRNSVTRCAWQPASRTNRFT